MRQAIAAALGVAGMLVAICIPPSLYQRHWRFLYGGTIGVMVFVFVFAEAVRGSKRWIDVGPFQFQPSEFGKLFFVLAIAGFLVERGRRVGELVDGADGRRPRPRADGPRLPPARPRHRARLRRRRSPRVLFLSGVRWLHLAILLGVTGLVARRERAVGAPGGGRRGAQAVPDRSPDRLHEPGQRSGRPDVQRHPVENGRRRRRALGPRCRGREPDAPRLPPRARDGLRLRLVRRAARVRRHARSCCCSTSSSSGAGFA